MKNKIEITLLTLLCLFTLSAITPCQKRQRTQNTKKAPVAKTKQTAVTDPKFNPLKKGGYNHKERIVTKYDRFENSTSVSMNLEVEKGDFIPDKEIQLAFFHKGEILERAPDNVLFVVSRNFPTNSLNYYTALPKQTSIIFLADNERIRVNALSQRSQFPGGFNYWSDRAMAVMPTKLLYYLANSESVEFQLGDMEFKLSADQLEAIRDFASRTNPAG